MSNKDGKSKNQKLKNSVNSMYNYRPRINEDTKSNHKVGLTQKFSTLSVKNSKRFEDKNKNRISKFSSNRGVKGKNIDMNNQNENINEKYKGNIRKDYDKNTNVNKYKTINASEKKILAQSYNPSLFNKKESEPNKEKKSNYLHNNYLMKKDKDKEKEKEEKEKMLKKKQEEIEKQIEKEKREKELIERDKEKERMKKKEEEEEKKREEKRKKEKEEKEEKEKKEREEKEKINNNIKNENKEQKEEENKELSTSSLEPNILKLITNQIGFKNLGNTCFMNTCLQNLIHSEYFIVQLFENKNLINSKTKISQRLFDMCNELIECKRNIYSPDDIKNSFELKHATFRSYTQQDTQEFCRIILEDINKELNRAKNPEPYKELKFDNDKIKCNNEFDKIFKNREDSLIIDTFYGQLINIFKCDCDYETFSFEKILDLPLLLGKDENNTSVKELLDDYFRDETIKFETKCEGCHKIKEHVKKVRISKPPNILILSLQRVIGRTGKKNNKGINFSDELDLSKYIDHDCFNEKDGITKYSLYAIGNHTGTLSFGHYYSYIKINGKWFEFNDSSVSSLSYDIEKPSKTVYVLFYTRKK